MTVDELVTLLNKFSIETGTSTVSFQIYKDASYRIKLADGQTVVKGYWKHKKINGPPGEVDEDGIRAAFEGATNGVLKEQAAAKFKALKDSPFQRSKYRK